MSQPPKKWRPMADQPLPDEDHHEQKKKRAEKRKKLGEGSEGEEGSLAMGMAGLGHDHATPSLAVRKNSAFSMLMGRPRTQPPPCYSELQADAMRADPQLAPALRVEGEQRLATHHAKVKREEAEMAQSLHSWLLRATTAQPPSSSSLPSIAQLEAIQKEEIRAEVIQTPLVGEKIPFESVAGEYDRDASPEFYKKALELCQTYDTIRVIRKDGNCFYRAFLVAQAELILEDPDERARFVSVCKGWKDRLLAVGFDNETTTDVCSKFNEFLSGIVHGGKNWKRVYEETFLDDNNANYLIIFLRLVASGYVKEHGEEYAPFLDGERTLAKYCEEEIEKMAADADHVAIKAFVHAMRSPIRIEYMDRGAAPDGGWHYEFPEASEQLFTPRINLLYRPGHYDIIYKK